VTGSLYILKEEEMKIRVYYEDTDIGGVVYYANYLKFIERARSELFFERGLLPFDEHGHFVVRSLCAEFLKSAKFGDTLDMHTQLTTLRAASVDLRQKVFCDDELLFEATIKLAYIGNGKVSKIPQDLRDIFEELS
jgi:acyl-CoA thioester hydrolase